MTAIPIIQPDDVHNRALAANVHPADWVNPKPQERYNLVVIGAGTAGLICAAGAVGLGARVALIEQHLMGGDCLNFGCVPSKGLIRASRALFDAARGKEFGVHPRDGITFDFGTAMERMRRIRAEISRHDSAVRYRDELGVDLFIGRGEFTAPDCIEVDGIRLFFERAAVCTGARASAPPIPGLAETGYLTNETVFSLTTLPKRLAVIGAGPIGCELAQAFARFGSRVTLIELGPRVLGKEDSDAARVIQSALVREGIVIQAGVTVTSVSAAADGTKITIEREGHVEVVIVDQILVGAGRIANTEGLGLARAGVACDPSGVTVNDRLQTSNKSIYAAGDVCSPHKFTHTADAMARILIANALFRGRQKTSALVIPWCTYTDPEVAHVGMHEQDAWDRGLEVTTLTVALNDNDRAIIDGEPEGFTRVHLKKGTDRILGATIVARHAGEMINGFTLAMTNGLGMSAIARTIHPYPTQGEIVRRLGDAYNRTRLTPTVKNILTAWLKWQRR